MSEKQFIEPIPVNLPFENMKFATDPTKQIDCRGWLEVALINAGAEITGKGCGIGGADLDFIVDGEKFNVVIKERPQ